MHPSLYLGFLPFQHRSYTAEKESIPKQVKKRRRFGQAGAMGYAYPFDFILINHNAAIISAMSSGMGASNMIFLPLAG